MTDPNASNPDPYASIPDAPQPAQPAQSEQPPQPTPYASAPDPQAPNSSDPYAPNPYASAPSPYAANPYTAGASSAPKAQTLSIISMVAGILGLLVGLTGWGLLISVAGVVLGHMGQRREKDARPFWLTGIITGYVGVALNLVIFATLVAVFFFAFTAAPTA